MEAKERIYETVDGKLVREGDPRGAFLAYAVGDQVGTDKEREVEDLTAPVADTAKVYHDDKARDIARVMVAEPTRETRAIASAELADDEFGRAPVLMSDRLVTELADEARSLANQDKTLKTANDDTAAPYRVWWTEDRSKLVKDGHPDARTLAYAPGDKVRQSDLSLFNSAEGAPGEEDTEATDTTKSTTDTTGTRSAKQADAPANKAATRTADK